MRSSTLESLHTGVSPGSIGCSTPIVALFREAQISVQPLWGFSSSNPHHSQSRAEQLLWGISRSIVDLDLVGSGITKEVSLPSSMGITRGGRSAYEFR